MAPYSPSVNQGRACIVIASVLWSLGGGLAKALTRDTPVGLNVPPLENAGLLIAFYRTIFAGLFLPTLRPNRLLLQARHAGRDWLSAERLRVGDDHGTAANASSCVPPRCGCTWPASGSWAASQPRHHRPDRQSVRISIILGRMEGSTLAALTLGIGGITYAGVVVYLRAAHESSKWLTVQNHLGGVATWRRLPWLTRPVGLSSPSSSPSASCDRPALPAGRLRAAPSGRRKPAAIMLIEPILNPLWAYLISDEVPLRLHLHRRRVHHRHGMALRARPGKTVEEDVKTSSFPEPGRPGA